MKIKTLIVRLRIISGIIREISNWPAVFLNYGGIKKGKTMNIRFRDGNSVKIKMPEKEGETSGLISIWDIWINKIYNPKSFSIKEKDTVLDIGANIGIFTLYASAIAKHGRIYSFEPFPGSCRRMAENIRINRICNAIANNLAVSSSNSRKTFFISNSCSSLHSLHRMKDMKESISVRAITLKEIIDSNRIKKVDFMKMDCEGEEYSIIYSTPRKYLEKIEKIALEFHNLDRGKNNCVYLKKYLEKTGYKTRIIFPENPNNGIIYAIR